MLRTLSALIALYVLAAPALAEDRRLPIEDFDRIVVEGPYIVHLVTGRSTSALARGSRIALDRLNIDVQGMMLHIRRNRNAWFGTPGADAGTVTIELTTRSLRSARLIGPARLDADNIRGLAVEFTVEGSGTLHATRVDADRLSLGLIGSGRLDLAGTARALTGAFQGTGDLAAAQLIANNARISSTTSGAIALTVNGPATIANDGLGNVRIFGRAVCTSSGVSVDQIRCGGSDQGQHR